ncbi:alpha/beta hydrolase [Candidatus Neomarinimicrobiota bacterium]
MIPIIALAMLLFISCKEDVGTGDPRLTAQLVVPKQIATKGLTQLVFGGNMDGILYVPESYSPDKTMPLMVAFHGAGGNSNFWKSYYDRAEARDMIFIAIDSQSRTWDLIIEDYGDDVQVIDKALKYVFNRCNIDPEHIALCGFSDGATYALSLGISNGDLFSHLIGYSPGYVISVDPVGKPKIYISHGTNDPVLPVEGSRDYILPNFINMGYDITYYEFRGGHTLPSSISEMSLDWFLGPIENNSEPGLILSAFTKSNTSL